MTVETAVSNKTPKIASDKPYGTVINVTPALAAEWLATNTGNRRVKREHVKSLARDMTEGRWTFTGEAIQFSREGRLLNGQHRLHAVVQSGETIAFSVVRGLDDDAQRHMDIGSRRSVSDALTMRGVKNASTAAAIGRLALLWETNRLTVATNGGGGAPTAVEVQDFIFNDDLIPLAAEYTMYLISKGLDMPGSVVGTAFWGIVGVGNTVESVKEFFTDLVEFRTDGDGDPKKALLQRFANRRRNGERLTQTVSLSLVVRAWNATVEGRRVAKFQSLGRDGKVTVPQPLVIPAS